MKLEFDGMFLKAEKKESKNGNEYYSVLLKDPVIGKQERIFIFDKKIIEKINSFKENDTVVFIFDYYYSSKSKKNILKVSDVVLC